MKTISNAGEYWVDPNKGTLGPTGFAAMKALLAMRFHDQDCGNKAAQIGF